MNPSTVFRRLTLISLLTVSICVLDSCASIFGNAFIVKDGAATAEIVIAEDAPRMTKLAAELRIPLVVGDATGKRIC